MSAPKCNNDLIEMNVPVPRTCAVHGRQGPCPVVRWTFGPVTVTSVAKPDENRWEATATHGPHERHRQVRYGTTEGEAEKKAVAAVLESVARSLRAWAASDAKFAYDAVKGGL